MNPVNEITPQEQLSLGESVPMSRQELDQALEHLPGILVRRDVSGSRCSTYGIGGAIARLVEVDDAAGLQAAVRVLSLAGEPHRMLGAGSNLLIADEGIPDTVLRLGGTFRRMEQQGSTGLFYIGAGASLMRVARDLSGAGYAGLEFAGGIPASIGGAVYMNAGAHGGEMSSVITRVKVCQPDGSLDELVYADLPVAYRKGGIPGGAIVIGAWLQLAEGDKELIEKRRQTFLEHRKNTQPLHLPSAGSVFKNPPGRVAGKLIEDAGLRGVTYGGAQISPQHGNWIVNPERTALASDVLHLMELCRSRVLEQTNILLETEQRLW